MNGKINGIDVNTLNSTIEAVKQNPVLAKCTFSTHTVWKKGFQNQTEISSFVQAGETVNRGKTFKLGGDHPEVLLGQNTAPAAVETLIAATSACIAGGWATFGAAMGVQLDSLKIDLEGDIDLQGFMGTNNKVKPGLNKIRGKIFVKSHASDKQLQELKEMAEKMSPVVNSLKVPVQTELVHVKN
ncbi:MAG: OsmC family protein [archaeon GW2011_AR10]|uniref:OsmC family protein n=1 Tax=Candidatus Iainarchaeum sp. TaxID=3101447 RepID=A0A7J4IYQ3_9ARCH|nr:MAG: OsmC family protein [archaeon GW2011_AR10]HIH08096.1 OsmC family protein [Candidatus Diapherotrites archaeon]